jgi:hypothetical protein
VIGGTRSSSVSGGSGPNTRSLRPIIASRSFRVAGQER